MITAILSSEVPTYISSGIFPYTVYFVPSLQTGFLLHASLAHNSKPPPINKEDADVRRTHGNRSNERAPTFKLTKKSSKVVDIVSALLYEDMEVDN